MKLEGRERLLHFFVTGVGVRSPRGKREPSRSIQIPLSAERSSQHLRFALSPPECGRASVCECASRLPHDFISPAQ